MSDKKTASGGILVTAIISFLIGFWFYGNINNALYITIFGIGCSMIVILGLIPVVGTFFGLLLLQWLKSMILTKVFFTPAIWIIFWYNAVLMCLVSFLILITLIMARNN